MVEEKYFLTFQKQYDHSHFMSIVQNNCSDTFYHIPVC